MNWGAVMCEILMGKSEGKRELGDFFNIGWWDNIKHVSKRKFRGCGLVNPA
jgi:hypothetical protein